MNGWIWDNWTNWRVCVSVCMENDMELGSEFSLSLSSLNKSDNNLEFYLKEYTDVLYLDSGRSAIRYLSRQLHEIDEVLLPEFICESVINCFNVDKIHFYRLNNDFTVDVEDIRSKMTQNTKLLFLMHYFGAIQPENVLYEIQKIAKETQCTILEDATHSIFGCKRTIGDYVVASVRKWLPIPKGGVLFSVNDTMGLQRLSLQRCIDNEKAYGMILKDMFLKNQLECNNKYREIFVNSERKLDEQTKILGMSDFSRYVASCIDVIEMKQRRQKNYRYLKDRLAELKLFSAANILEEECPFVFPVRVPNRDMFRKYLIDNKIFCAVHWPVDGIREAEREVAVYNSNTLISLPIDQRYDAKHMDYMVDVILKYGGELLF